MSTLTMTRAEIEDEVREAEQAYREAYAEFNQALRQLWPEGTRVGVILNSRQTNPTPTTVVMHWKPGYVRVRLEKPGRSGKQYVHDIPWERITSL